MNDNIVNQWYLTRGELLEVIKRRRINLTSNKVKPLLQSLHERDVSCIINLDDSLICLENPKYTSLESIEENSQVLYSFIKNYTDDELINLERTNNHDLISELLNIIKNDVYLISLLENIPPSTIINSYKHIEKLMS